MRYNRDPTPVSEMGWGERVGFAAQMVLGLVFAFAMLLMPLLLGITSIAHGDLIGGAVIVLIQLVFWLLFGFLNIA